MTLHNQYPGKLVRNKIPEIIRSTGREPIIYRAGPDEYRYRLREKLCEEASEFLESGDREELADILEVVYALASLSGTDKQELEQIREDRAGERGGFTDRIVWLYNLNAE